MLLVGENYPVGLEIMHVPYPMPVLRTRQSGGLDILQCMWGSVGPPTVPCIVPALRDGEPGQGDGLLLVRGPAVGAQALASPALSSHRRRCRSRGGCRAWRLHIPPEIVRRCPSGAPRQRGPRRASRSLPPSP